MTFVVTYRGGDGALREEAVEAAGRAECVSALRARGIVPVSVREDTGGRSRRDGGSPRGRNELRPSRHGATGNSATVHSTILRAAILAALMLAAAGGAWWWLGRTPRTSRPAGAEDIAATQAVTRVEKPKAKPEPVATHVPVSNAAPAQHETYLGQAVVFHSCVTNADGSVRELIRTADGKLHGIRRPPPGSEPIFHNAADQAIAMALSVSDTVSTAPLPGIDGNLDEEFAKAVKTPIEINDDDLQAVKDLKKAVMETREEIMRLMENGQSFSQVLKEHVRLSRENYDIRANAMKELKKIVDAGDSESAEKYLKRVNAALEQMGVTKLDMPMNAEEKAAFREAVRRERERIRKEKSK